VLDQLAALNELDQSIDRNLGHALAVLRRPHRGRKGAISGLPTDCFGRLPVAFKGSKPPNIVADQDLTQYKK
jgi:hypothetical protein